MANEFDLTGTPEYSQFIHLSRYSRWLEKEQRRETWDETVERYISFFCKRFPELENEIRSLKKYILEFKVMPSMRCLMTAGKALEKDNASGFNCSYIAIDHPRAFDEAMYLLMCGCGVGFSVERQYINKLPEISEEFHETDTVIIVPDSKVGWAKSFRELISLLYVGQIPKWDLTNLRPAGAKLKTFGGRSSGPAPLDKLFKFCVNSFKNAAGRKLTSIECHDIVCMTAETVVCGGVRRSATISLSNLSDDRMRTAKSGQWYVENPQRRIANNSAAYTEKPDFQVFTKEWISLYESKSGERGIYSRVAAKKHVERNNRRDFDYDFGLNPCAEILLRSQQFCNLSEVVIRKEDTTEEMMEKCRVASIFGTLQSTLTDFRYLRKKWKENTEEECLLGVSLTGILDNEVFGNPDNEALPNLLQTLKQAVIDTNRLWAKKLNVNPSVATTAVKPSGTVSQLVNSSSGIHPRYSKYYTRNVRCDIKDPMTQFMISRNFPHEADCMNPTNVVFSFPIESPDQPFPFAKDLTAEFQLKLWKVYKENWCEHNPSCTVYYRDNEFLEVGQWIWNNFDEISGISFLPYSDHIYQQAPYEPINKEKYEELLAKMPKVDWSELKQFEKEDSTKGTQTFACSGNSCDVVDLT